MKNLKILAALGLLGVAGATQAAGLSSTWTLTNDYDFRGFTQSSKDPAIQASLDYAFENGLYLGAWASNIDFGDTGTLDSPDVELDLYAGFTGGDAENGVGYDVGAVYYTYPEESDFNYLEAYASVSHGWFKAKVWYSPNFGGKSVPGAKEGWYTEANATIPLPANFSVSAHAGYSFGDYWDDSDEVLDYSVGVGYTYEKFTFGLKWVDQDTDIKIHHGAFENDGRVIFTVATTLPW